MTIYAIYGSIRSQKGGGFMSFDKFKANDELWTKSIQIYNRIIRFVNNNMKDDYYYYDLAVVTLKDGEKVYVRFDDLDEAVFFYMLDSYDNINIRIDFEFWTRTIYGLSPHIRVHPLDDHEKKDCAIYSPGGFSYSPKKDIVHSKFTESEMDLERYCLDLALYKTSKMTYDKETTHSPLNLNEEGRKRYFYNTLAYLQEKDPTITVLPSVQFAVNTVGDSLVEYSDHTIKPVDLETAEKFKQSLAKNVMISLSRGSKPVLNNKRDFFFDNRIKEIFEELGMKNYRATCKTLCVGVDYVYADGEYLYKEVILDNPLDRIKPIEDLDVNFTDGHARK